MSGAAVVFQREFAGLFRAPFTWVVLLVVLLLNGLLFNGYLTASGNVSAALDGAMCSGRPAERLLEPAMARWKQ